MKVAIREARVYDRGRGFWGMDGCILRHREADGPYGDGLYCRGGDGMEQKKKKLAYRAGEGGHMIWKGGP